MVCKETKNEEGEKGTLFKELVTMDCPWIASKLCIDETNVNRGLFLRKLSNNKL